MTREKWLSSVEDNLKGVLAVSSVSVMVELCPSKKCCGPNP